MQVLLDVTPEISQALKRVIEFLEDIVTAPPSHGKKKKPIRRRPYTEAEHQQIAALVEQDKTNKQIARALGRTEQAIATQISVMGIHRR